MVELICSLILVFIIYKYNTYYKFQRKTILRNIFKSCIKHSSRYLNISKYIHGYSLWNKTLHSSKSEICRLLNSMGLVRKRNILYFNSLYAKYNTSYHNKYNSFPDKSYYRLTPKRYDKEEILFGTYDFQHYMYTHQHPFNCLNKRFLLIKGWPAGHISEIHVLSSYLKIAFDSNRIAVFDKRYKSYVANGRYCYKYSRNWECYLEPLSNCSISDIDIKSAVKYINEYQKEKIAELYITSRYLYKVPKFIYTFFKGMKFSEMFYSIYWTIQSVCFLFRINERTYNYLLKNNSQIRKIKKKEYINVWIRHGDKYQDMKLIPTYLYYSSIEFFFKIWGKSSIYVSSDDPDAIDNIDRLYNVNYLKYERNNHHSYRTSIIKGDRLTLNVIADILIALSSIGFSGTLKSNIANILNELRMTVGYRLNSPFFEIGELNNSQIFVSNLY